MEAYDLNVEKREVLGKGAVRKLKNEGFIPGVLYNDGSSIPIAVEEEQIRHIVGRYGTEVFLNLDFDGTPIKVMIKELQREPVNKEIQHIDLMPVEKNILH
ncbi:MAG: 50S ribosomal protein L25 [Clostridia bacterium]|nr:50S ribosomal protein L25 [Clostridia bacterium]